MLDRIVGNCYGNWRRIRNLSRLGFGFMMQRPEEFRDLIGFLASRSLPVFRQRLAGQDHDIGGRDRLDRFFELLLFNLGFGGTRFGGRRFRSVLRFGKSVAASAAPASSTAASAVAIVAWGWACAASLGGGGRGRDGRLLALMREDRLGGDSVRCRKMRDFRGDNRRNGFHGH